MFETLTFSLLGLLKRSY